MFAISVPARQEQWDGTRRPNIHPSTRPFIEICLFVLISLDFGRPYTHVCAVIKSSSCPVFLGGLHDTEFTLTLVCFLCFGSRCSANAQMFSWYQLQHHLSNPNSKFKVHRCPSGSQVCWVSCVSGSKKISSSFQYILSTASEMLSTNTNQS